MESYQKAKVPPPVPPKYKLASAASSVCQKENVFENGYHRQPAPVTGGALIQTNGMRVKIQINPENPVSGNNYRTVLGSTSQSNGNALKINVNGTVGAESHRQSHDMLLRSAASCANCNNNIDDYNLITNNKNIINTFNNNVTKSSSSSKYIGAGHGGTNGYFCSIPSGQSSPSDNLDSGTCSDVDTGTSPPPPPHFSVKKKSNSKSVAPQPPPVLHQRSGSLNSSGIGVDSEDEDNVSCDSINSSEYNGESEHALPIISAAILKCSDQARNVATSKIAFQENSRHTKHRISCEREYLTAGDDDKSAAAAAAAEPNKIDDTRPYDDLENTDRYLHFHLNEKNFDYQEATQSAAEDDTFAGFKSLVEKSAPVATIHSAKGTVRGVKNRVRAGIATFLNNNVTKVSECSSYLSNQCNYLTPAWCMVLGAWCSVHTHQQSFEFLA